MVRSSPARPRIAVLALTAGTALLVATAVSASPAARSAGAAPAKAFRIGLVEPSLSNPFIKAMADGAKARAKKVGVTLLVVGSNDPTAQVNAAETYIGSKVDALIVNAIDSKAISTAVQDANKAGIPVVSLQAPPASGKTVSVITNGLRTIGVLNGKQVVAYCATRNPCKVGLIEGSIADQSGVTYQNGLLSVIKGKSNIKVVAKAPTNYDSTEALNATQTILTAHPDVNVFFYWWSAGLLAGVEALKNAGKTGQIALVSGSAPCQSIQALLKGETYGDVMSFPEIEGAYAVDAAVAALKHQPVKKSIETPSYPITKQSALAILAGKIKPPASLPVLAHLKKAKGTC
jgi:ribose transport system substrate-binding protein